MISSKMSDPNNYDDSKINGRDFVERGFHSPILKTVFGKVQVDKTLEKTNFMDPAPHPHPSLFPFFVLAYRNERREAEQSHFNLGLEEMWNSFFRKTLTTHGF